MPHFEMAECPVCGKLHTVETILKKNLAIAMAVLSHSHGVENAEVWVAVADIRIARIGARTNLDAIIL